MLPDLLALNLKLVICGTAAGNRSASLQQYYAGRGNKFWKIIFNIGLTPILLSPPQYAQLLEFGIGLTDLVKTKSGMDSNLTTNDFDSTEFTNKINSYNPMCLCFNGKRAATEYLLRDVTYGIQLESIGKTIIYIAPSTSAAAGGSWNEKYWIELSQLVNKKPPATST